MRGAMASYCCFRKKTMTPLPSFTIPREQSMSLQHMICLVLRPEGEVVVIEGIGGLGKTWAAKAAFETARNSNRFDNYMWVSLSRSCSLRRCIEKIATCLSIDIGDELSSSRIRVMIKEHLARRKFLLILDNAYFVEENILWHLGVPSPREQSLGSKVIVTTRTRRALSVMDPALVIMPQALLYQDSYDLLREKIGKDIDLELIDNCYGMPLSIILLAGALCDVPTQEEFSKLIGEAYVAQGPKVSVFTTMIRLVKFGYRRLPSDTARHCFLYCLLFPDDEAISVKDLIMFWKLDGMIQEASGSHEANCNGKEIIHVLLKHGLIHSEGDDHIRMHDVIRETVSQLGRDNGYVEQPERYFDGDVRFENLAKLGGRISLMNTIKEELRVSPIYEYFSTSTLLLRGNRHMRTISEGVFFRMGMLRVLDLSFTRIRILPQSVSHLFYLRLLLLVGCGHLEKIQHIGSLEMLEILNASGCGSLKSVEFGSFDRMRLLKILDLSRTSIEYLPSLAACKELNQLLLQDCPCPKSEQTTETNHNSCDTEYIKFPYGVSKTGAVSNLHIGTSNDLVNWMDMLWLPCGLTFELSDRFGMRVSQDVKQNGKTNIHASHANFFRSLDEDSPLWSNCFRKFHIVISPLNYDQTVDNCFGVRRTKFSAVDAQSSDFHRVLEINRVSIPNDLEGILRHTELISFKSVTATNLVWTLNTGRPTAAPELWIEDCHQLENVFLLEEGATMVKSQNIWISNMDSLEYFCQGTEDSIFSCLMHLHLDCCPKLSFIFPSCLRLPNLRSLHIRFCDSLERVFDETVAAEHALPGLQSLQLWELPELSCICGGVLPSLRELKVKGCAKLKGIPIGLTENNPFFTTIVGDTQWWNGLVWDDESIKRWILFRNWGPLLPHFATEG